MGNCCGTKKGSADITSDKRKPGGANKPFLRRVRRDDFYSTHQGLHGQPTDKRAEPPALPEAKSAKKDVEKEVLKIQGIDFNIIDNVKVHHTEKYEIIEERLSEDGKPIPGRLVVRRGLPFDINITFDRPFNSEKDEIKLIFDTGPRPSAGKGTAVYLKLSDKDTPKEWGAKIIAFNENVLQARIYTPSDCIVSKWNLKIDVSIKRENNTSVFRYKNPSPVYILFNPWCSDDQVYLDDETSRMEYVLNDKGKIYRGTVHNITAKPWNFGQFEDFVLDTSLTLLEKCELSYRVRNNAVIIARKIAAMVCPSDDSGILVGGWSGKYADGTSPLSWTGSVGILDQLSKTRQPVRYGQCWVFAGVVTTICRALGIPARSVTNYNSAQDVDGSVVTSTYWSADGDPLNKLNGESLWNFHVWNEVWMSRADLPAGYGGWQALDATPQETSEGLSCIGPVSVEAIKNGLVQLPYDGEFIFSSINGDRMNWIKNERNGWDLTKQTKILGKSISTKAPLTQNRMDITSAYKFKDGTQQERTAIWRAAKPRPWTNDVNFANSKDVTFDLSFDTNALIGKQINIIVKAQNGGNDQRNIKFFLTTSVIHYTGTPYKIIKSATYQVKADPHSGGEISMTLKPEEYLDKLVEMCTIQVDCMARVTETNQYNCQTEAIQLTKPEIKLEAPKEVKVGEEFEIQAYFTNPLNVSLTKAGFVVEGARLQKPIAIKHGAVGPRSEARVSAKLKANKPGIREIVVGFDSKELSDIYGSSVLKVLHK